MTKTLRLLYCLLPLLAVGCSQDEKNAEAKKQQAAAAAPVAAAPSAPPAVPTTPPTAPPAAPMMAGGNPHPGGAIMPGLAQPAEMMSNSGSVVSVEQAGTYSYIEVDVNGGRYWLATNTVDVAPGEVIRWGRFSIMRNFTSKTLGKTFPQVLFVGGIAKGAPEAAAAAPAENRGQVVSSLESGGYTYLEVNGPNGQVWLAAPTTPVKNGDTVGWGAGSVMRNFYSKTLDRTFESIVFLGSVQVIN